VKECQISCQRLPLAAEEAKVPVIYTRCCGLDVHKASVTACVLVFDGKGNDERIKQFGTTTAELIRLRCWLKNSKVTHVAMESTGVYWKPVWHELKAHFDLTLVNPQYVKQRQGHKTDTADSRWIAGQLQIGELPSSFVPGEQMQHLRDWTRYRTHLVQDRTRTVNRIHRLLEDAGIKLSCVATDIMGATGRLIFAAILRGQTDPAWLADYAKTALRGKKKELEAALRGHITEHHKDMLGYLLEDFDRQTSRIVELETRIRAAVEPHAGLITRMCEVPGIEETACWTILAEAGHKLEAFPTAGQFASWAGICPGNAQSAGKRKHARTMKGNRYLRRMLIQCAWAGTRKTDSFLRAFYLRKTARLGPLKALVALAHRLALILYNLLTKDQTYREFGIRYYDRKNPLRTAKRLIQRITSLGLNVDVHFPGGQNASSHSPD
jgi:transposase